MTGQTMTVGQLREALVAWRPDAPVMIHPTGNPDDPAVPLSHVGRGATFPQDADGFPTGDAPLPFPLLVVDKAAAKKLLAPSPDGQMVFDTGTGQVVPGVTVTVRGPSFSVVTEEAEG